MTDVFTPEKRSEVMSHIRSRDTSPERIVRSMLHRMGYRFRICVKSLPGHPDIVLPKYGTVIFVHGCFWHQHPGCRYATMPATRRRFWKQKFKANRERDERVTRSLEVYGWRVLVVWECELRAPASLSDRLHKELQPQD